jgi:hypothetical protein
MNVGEESLGTIYTVSVSNATGPEPEKASKEPSSKKWKKFNVDPHRNFAVSRPTKLIDGSRGGQAFMCGLLRPPDTLAYSIEEQARMQMWSVLLVAVGLMHRGEIHFLSNILAKDFQLDVGLGKVFVRLGRGLIIANILILGLIVTVFYALWQQNIFGEVAPFVIRLCSLASWAVGATGLLMLGGNPSVEIGHDGEIPAHIRERIYPSTTQTTQLAQNAQVTQSSQASQNSQLSQNPQTAEGALAMGSRVIVDGRLIMDENGNVELQFGSLHGSVFTPDQGKCHVPADALEAICSLEMKLSRTRAWYIYIIWFTLHLGVSIALQIAGAKVATVASEIMGVAILIVTSVFRGAGVSGPEEWMIPGWAMRPGGRYTVPMLGKFMSRT